MDSIFVIPRAQSLTFRQVEGMTNSEGITFQYLEDNITFDNRLLRDQRFSPATEPVDYNQKFNRGDQIYIQFTTTWAYSNLSVQLFDYNNLQVGSNIEIQIAYPYTDGSLRVSYDSIISTSNLSYGVYYVKITGVYSTIVFVSEKFEVGNYLDLPLLEWRDSDGDGVYYKPSTIFGFRIEGVIKYKPESEVDEYVGFNFKSEILKSVAKRGFDFITDSAPLYIAEKIELAFKHKEVYVNKARHYSTSSISIDQATDSNFVAVSIAIIDYQYEDYTILQAIAGVVINDQPLTDFDNSEFTDYNDTVFYSLM